MRAKSRRGPKTPMEFATGITPCRCGKGEDRRITGSICSDGSYHLVCVTCHEPVAYETTTLSRRAVRDLERELLKPHSCQPKPVKLRTIG